jgi:PBSX family phage terminase large subunit
MATVKIARYTEASKPYQPRGAALELFYCKDKEILLVGAAGTGKSRAALEKVHLVLQKYNGSRALIVRKTRKSMTQSTLVTLEEKCIQEGFFTDSIQRSHRQSYVYPNKSELVVGGLDDPANILSTEYDVILIDEATQITEADYEILISRLRNHKMPYQQIICACNPDSPQHWLNQRALKGMMTRLTSLHKDNPAVTQDYLDMLDRLTGVRKLRLRDGVWAGAEGRVFDDFDPSIHIVNMNVPKSFFNGGFFASMDFGFVHATVLQVWGLDEDRRMYLVHEVYRTGKTIDWWIEEARKACSMFDFNLFVCDSARPDHIDLMKKKGLNAILAYKSIDIGLQAVAERLRIQPDGKPRLMLFDDCLHGKDDKLIEQKKPWSTAQEFDCYVWADGNKEQPAKENDDGMDAMRYAVCYADKLGSGIAIAK